MRAEEEFIACEYFNNLQVYFVSIVEIIGLATK